MLVDEKLRSKKSSPKIEHAKNEETNDAKRKFEIAKIENAKKEFEKIVREVQSTLIEYSDTSCDSDSEEPNENKYRRPGFQIKRQNLKALKLTEFEEELERQLNEQEFDDDIFPFEKKPNRTPKLKGKKLSASQHHKLNP